MGDSPEAAQYFQMIWSRLEARKQLRHGFVSELTGLEKNALQPQDGKNETVKQYKVFTGTWNVGGVAPPDDLDLSDLLDIETDYYDIYVLGFQEIVPLNARNVLGPKQRSAATKWHTLIADALNNSRSRTQEASRTQFYSLIVRVVLLGDLNYRIAMDGGEARQLVGARKWGMLLENDELLLELSAGRQFDGWREGHVTFAPTYKYRPNSDEFHDSTGAGHRRKQHRAPAWCDRILWRGKGMRQARYERCGGYRLSDHRPVRAVFHAVCEVAEGNVVR
ncbi:unnamed protein product [Urochloa decumbens]|uniref:Inositol polyphosphate-related phosphatase domain-containing protein n=1 Tax=Urochloa decumbens TaxID=240449 RepID=A0ABC9C3P6_9POAL